MLLSQQNPPDLKLLLTESSVPKWQSLPRYATFSTRPSIWPRIPRINLRSTGRRAHFTSTYNNTDATCAGPQVIADTRRMSGEANRNTGLQYRCLIRVPKDGFALSQTTGSLPAVGKS